MNGGADWERGDVFPPLPMGVGYNYPPVFLQRDRFSCLKLAAVGVPVVRGSSSSILPFLLLCN